MNTNQNKRWVLQSGDGRWASYNTRTGPFLTDNKELRYQWERYSSAELEKENYEAAFGVPLLIVAV